MKLIKKFKKVCRTIWSAYKVSFSVKSKMALFVGFLGIPISVFSAISGKLMECLVNGLTNIVTGTEQEYNIWSLIGLLFLLYAVQEVYSFAENYFNNVNVLKIRRYIKQRILELNTRVKYKYILNYDNYKEKTGFAGSYAGNRIASCIDSTFIWIYKVVGMLAILYVLRSVPKGLLCLLIFGCIPTIVLELFHGLEDFNNRLWQTKKFQKVMHEFTELSGPREMHEVRYWGIYKYLKSSWKRDADSYISEKDELGKRHIIQSIIADILRDSTFIAVIVYTAYTVYTQASVKIGSFILVLTLAQQLQNITSELLKSFTAFTVDYNYIETFFSLDRLEYENLDETDIEINLMHIEFKDVSFCYPGSTHKAISNINVEITPGEKIAIVGENGSGKTTFINLLCGLLEPDTGEILINQIPLKSNLAVIRKKISAVFQDFGKYNCSLAKNIHVCDSDSIRTDEKQKKIYSVLEIDKLADTLPNGYSEELGAFSEYGRDFSSGQWQRIAIARALSKKDACTLILDEPTAALDPIAEANLFSSFCELSGKNTTLLVTHRLGIVNLVDRVLVFKDGQIVEDGSPHELLSNNGEFAKMYKAQANWYL